MEDFLTAVKSARTQGEDDPSLLKVVKSSETSSPPDLNPKKLQEHQGHESGEFHTEPATPEEVLQLLRSQPNADQVVAALGHLNPSNGIFPGSKTHFNVCFPGPLQAKIVQTLLATTVPDFWPVLEEPHRVELVACLRHTAGFNALVAHLRLYSSQSGQNGEHSVQRFSDLLDVAERLFSGDETLSDVYHNLHDAIEDKTKCAMSWREHVNLVASGKVIASIAQAEDIIKGSARSSWLGKGSDYASWLGRNIIGMVVPDTASHGTIIAAAQVLIKSLSLGYPNALLHGLFVKLMHDGENPLDSTIKSFVSLMQELPKHTVRTFTEQLLRWLSNLETGIAGNAAQERTKEAAAIAALLSDMLQVQSFKQDIMTFLADPQLSTSASLSVRRACLAAVSRDDDDEIQLLLDKVMSTFSNVIFINHSPILQQETLAQTLLLAAGYVYRKANMALLLIARSSNHMQAVSNRLDSANPRARWLGMVVGTAISSLVDKEGSRMSFGTDDMETEEAEWYKGLVKVCDDVGTLREFAILLSGTAKTAAGKVRSSRRGKAGKPLQVLNGKPVFGPPRPPVQTEVVGEKVSEILDEDSDEEEEEELKPYAKPDSDPEDSDEDATLVNRNKARPPVYIRELMSALRDDKSHDRFQLGIKHAAALIRRKTNFGREVKDHAEELAAILCNLQDPFETEQFDELRLQALIATLLSDVKVLAPWLSKQAFSGDYSVAQRCLILSALGLGGRELAGLQDEDEFNPQLGNTDFPSKRLPSHLHSTYNVSPSPVKRLEAASKNIEHSLIKPLALQAADRSTAHLNAVKVRTFSSRMDIERTKRKPTPNQLAKVFGEALFYPLANRYQQEIAAYGSASVFASVPFVLVTFLKTLALLLHASGPPTLGLFQMSAEFWDLLLSLRVRAMTDSSILHAVLFSLLTLLEINQDKRRIATETPKQLMETQKWVDLIFERTGDRGLGAQNGDYDEDKLRTMAAGVLVKTQEIIELYQKG